MNNLRLRGQRRVLTLRNRNHALDGLLGEHVVTHRTACSFIVHQLAISVGVFAQEGRHDFDPAVQLFVAHREAFEFDHFAEHERTAQAFAGARFQFFAHLLVGSLGDFFVVFQRQVLLAQPPVEIVHHLFEFAVQQVRRKLHRRAGHHDGHRRFGVFVVHAPFGLCQQSVVGLLAHVGQRLVFAERLRQFVIPFGQCAALHAFALHFEVRQLAAQGFVGVIVGEGQFDVAILVGLDARQFFGEPGCGPVEFRIEQELHILVVHQKFFGRFSGSIRRRPWRGRCLGRGGLHAGLRRPENQFPGHVHCDHVAILRGVLDRFEHGLVFAHVIQRMVEGLFGHYGFGIAQPDITVTAEIDFRPQRYGESENRRVEFGVSHLPRPDGVEVEFVERLLIDGPGEVVEGGFEHVAFADIADDDFVGGLAFAKAGDGILLRQFTGGLALGFFNLRCIQLQCELQFAVVEGLLFDFQRGTSFLILQPRTHRVLRLLHELSRNGLGVM